ncbi:MAG: hypothetical protein N2257_07030 [Thermodesulfovibrionales bacterium]|nr:hypothetical protein [Thermodesulfovibrionales bacterium]
MNKLQMISKEYGSLMHTFSARTIDNLRHQAFFRVLMPAISKFIDDNVEKEIKKDSLAIKLIFDAFNLERKVSKTEFDKIIEKTKRIDEEFLEKTSSVPLSLKIPYNEVEELRRRRIETLARFVCTILHHWMDEESLHSAIRLAYKKEDLKKLIFNILHLYNLETKILSSSVKLPLILKPAKESLSRALFDTMESVAREIAEEWSARFFT